MTNLYVRDPFESKYQLPINGTEKLGVKPSKNLKAFSDYSQTNDGVSQNFEDYNLTNKRRLLIVFHNIIADMESHRKLNPIVT